MKTWFYKTFYASQLTQKLTKRMFLIYFTLYILLLILLLFLIFPILNQKAINEVESTNSLVQKEFKSTQSMILGNMGVLAFNPEIGILLSNYDINPTKSNKSLISLYLQTFCVNFENNALIMIENMDREIFTSFNYSDSIITSLITKNLNYQALLSMKYGSYFSPIYQNIDLRISTPDFPLLYISKIYYINHEPYIITIVHNATSCLQRSELLYKESIDGIFILNDKNNLIYSSNYKYSNQYLNNPLWTQFEPNGFTFAPHGVYFYEKNINSNWVVFSYVTYITLWSNIISIFSIIFLLYLISPILYSLFLIPTNNKFLLPLKILSDEMSSYSPGNKPHLDIKTQDEIENLCHIFNAMVHKIDQQIIDISKKEQESAQTYYKLLATQIDPHFIYNTMGIINILAEQNNTSSIIEVNNALIKILRERLNSKITIFDTIDHEIETLKQCALIMDIRYNSTVDIYFDIDPKLSGELIPKNILQPIFENAFYHGLTNEHGVTNGHIDVVIYSMDYHINIEISDNGKGISPKRLHELSDNRFRIYDNNRAHIGLENIQQRLEYIYQNRYDMTIKSHKNHGTTISITLPFCTGQSVS